MTKINLLPWREERRKLRQKEFMGLLGLTALLAVAISFGVVKYYDALLENQTARNTRLETEIADLDKKIGEIAELEKKRSHLLSRKQVIEQLQADRSQMVHLFDQLARTIPDGVRLNTIKQAGAALTLVGHSQSSARVSSYMRALEQSGWMTSPDLSVIEAKTGDRQLPYEFSLTVTLTKPKSEADIEAENAASVASMAGGAQ